MGEHKAKYKIMSKHCKDANDTYIDLCGPITAEDAGKHGNAMLSEGPGRIAATAARFWPCRLQEQRFEFVLRELKDKIIRKTLGIAADSKVKVVLAAATPT
jgi:hypothetical protein